MSFTVQNTIVRLNCGAAALVLAWQCCDMLPLNVILQLIHRNLIVVRTFEIQVFRCLSWED